MLKATCGRDCCTRAKLADAHIARDLALVFRKDKALSRAALAFIEIAVKQKTPQVAGAPK